MFSAFVKLFFACVQATTSEADFVGELPVEISSTIFRYLDAESLVTAASVNHRWNAVCKSDVVLRRKIRKHLRREHKMRFKAYMRPSKTMRIIRLQDLQDVSTVQFGVRNGNVSIQNSPVKYEAPKLMNSQTKQFKISLKADGKNLTRSCSNIKKNKINVASNGCNIRNLRM